MNRSRIRCRFLEGCVLAAILAGAAAVGAPRADAATLEAAVKAQDAGHWPQAAALWKELAHDPAATGPGHRRAVEGYLEVLYDTGAYDELDAEAQKALSADPGWARAAILRARGLAARGRPGDGAQLLAAVAGASWPAAVERAQLLTVTGKRDEASEVMQGVLDAYDPSRSYDPGDLTALGRAAAYRGAYQDASRMLQTAIKDSTGFLPARIALADLFQSRYQSKLAGDEVQAAGQIAPHDPEVLLLAARFAADNHQFTRADEAAREVLSFRPGDASALAVRAQVALVADDAAGARAFLEPVLAADPTDRAARSWLAAAGYVSGDSTLYRSSVKQVLEQDPGYLEVFSRLAGILEDGRRNDEAIAQYRRMLARDPGNAVALNGIGLLLMREGNEKDARGYLEKGFAGDKYNIRAFNQLQLLDKMDTFAVARTDHFVIRYQADTDSLLVPRMETALAGIYDDLTKLHGWKPKVPTVVEVFPTHDWFSARVTGFAWVEGIPAVCFGDVIAMDSPRTLTGGTNWREVLRHEYGHVLALGMTRMKVPFWFTEGLSVHLEGYPRGLTWDENLRAAYEDGELVPVDSLTLAFTRPKSFDQRLLAYHEAALIVDDIVDRHGWDSVPKLLREFGDGKKLPEAVHDVLGESYPEFSGRCLDRVRTVAAALPVWPRADRERTGRLEAAAQDAPGDADLWEKLAVARYQQGQAGPAIEAAGAVLKLRPGDGRAQAVIGLAERADGRTEDARRDLERAATAGSRDVPAWLALGEMRLAAADTAGALDAYGRALAVYPLASPALVARAHIFTAEGDTASARFAYHTLLSQDDGAGSAAVELARLELNAGNGDAAAQALAFAAGSLPLDPDVDGLLGQAYLLLGRDRDAYELFLRARTIDLKSVESMVGMARYYLKRGDAEEAAYFARLALKYDPDHPVAKAVLAEAQAW